MILSVAARAAAIVQPHHIALLLDGRADLVRPGGADGVHLGEEANYAAARRVVGDGIVGVHGATRHEAMLAAEQGADYIALGDFDDAAPTETTVDLTAWWSETMTVPCVAAGCANARDAAVLANAGADFLAISPDASSTPEGLPALLRDIAAAAGSP